MPAHTQNTIANLLVIFVLFFVICPEQASSKLLTEKTYKKLSRIHELVSTNKYNDALVKLDALSTKIKNNKYETALVNQTYAYIYASRENYPKAIAYYKKSLTSGALDKRLVSDIRFSLGQIYIMTGDYKQGISILEPMLESAERSTPNVQILAASAYIELKAYQKAVNLLESALKQVNKPRESWQQMLLSVYYKLKQYRKAAILLEELVERFPDKKIYWNQLSSVYFSLNMPLRSLSTMELAYQRGLYVKETELKNLVNLYLLNNIPLKAAEAFVTGLDQGIVGKSEKNWLHLANIWLVARESGKGIQVLNRAFSSDHNPDIGMRMLDVFLRQQKWNDVITLTQTIIDRSNASELDRAYYHQGIAYYEVGQYKKALKSLQKIKNPTGVTGDTATWIQHIKTAVVNN